jgi:hypothetical protein
LQQLTEQGRKRIDELAQRYSISTDAVMTLLQSLVNSDGTMAQFTHRELGGSGQWMRGGMTMVGDMFNHGLKAKVEGFCSELSQLVAQQPFVPFTANSQAQSQGGNEAAEWLRGCRFREPIRPRGKCFGPMVACGTRFPKREWWAEQRPVCLISTLLCGWPWS